jgi:hypothetical protein
MPMLRCRDRRHATRPGKLMRPRKGQRGAQLAARDSAGGGFAAASAQRERQLSAVAAAASRFSFFGRTARLANAAGLKLLSGR